MLDLLYHHHSSKRYFLRDICNSDKPRYKPIAEQPNLITEQQKRCMDALTIDLQQSHKCRQTTIIDTLDLDINHHHRGREKSIEQAFTFKEYMEYALYDAKIGYYTTRPGIGTDFRTQPMRHSPYYGMWLCEVLFQLWVKMLDDDSLAINEPFQLIEPGAGTGILARDILMHAKNNTTPKNSLRNLFYKNLFYLIIEISPELVAKQKKSLSNCEEKYAIMNGDIRHLNKEITNKLSGKGIILSNELPDAFSMHKVRWKDDKFQVSIVYPALKPSLKPTEKNIVADRFIRRFMFKNTNQQPKGTLLSKQLYRHLTRNMTLDEIYKYYYWEEVWVDGGEIAEIRSFAPEHIDFISGMIDNREYPLNTDLRLFQKKTSELITTGYKVTIDYQEDNTTILKTKGAFRCYPGGFPHDLKVFPGTNDITADVNASTLAAEGIATGWKPVFFGIEKMLLGVAKHQELEYLEKVRMAFHVVIEKKGGKYSENSLPIIGSPLTYRELYVHKRDVLAKIFQDVLYQDPYAISMVAHNIYSALLELKTPSECHFGSKEKKILKRIYHSFSPLEKDLKKAMKLVFKRFLGKNSLLLIARDYKTLKAVDFNRIAPIFDQTKTSDKTDYLAYLIIKQLFQMLFYFQNHPAMLPYC
jgi:SAM-dependent MidA family methyltransferase